MWWPSTVFTKCTVTSFGEKFWFNLLSLSVNNVLHIIGQGTELCSEKIHGIDSERFPLSRGRKCSFRSPWKSQFGSSKRNGIMRQKLFLQNSQSNLTKGFVCTSKVVFSDTIFEMRESDSKRKFPVRADRIESILPSAKCFRKTIRKFASIFVPRDGIPSRFLFRGMVWNKISKICF